MSRHFLAIGILIGCAGALAAQAPQSPTPGAEQKNLAYFVGTWNVEGTMQASPFGPAGTNRGTETCRMFEGGWHLVCDSDSTGAMGPMKAHTVMTYDLMEKQYRYFSISNLPAAETATGTRTNGRWDWTTDVTMAGKTIYSRFSMTELSPSSYGMKWEISNDKTSWQPVFEGKAVKATR